MLRGFEQRMLQELGYALTLDHDVASGKPIDPSREYFYEIERGPVRYDLAPRMVSKFAEKH